MLYHSRFVKLRSCKLLSNLKSFAHSKLFQVSQSFLLKVKFVFGLGVDV